MSDDTIESFPVTRWFDDIGFYVTMEVESYGAEVRIWKAVSRPGSKLLVPLFGDDFEEDPTDDNLFFSGYIKWDGCSNWEFKDMLHFCSKEQASQVGVLFERIYDMAAQRIPNYD